DVAIATDATEHRIHRQIEVARRLPGTAGQDEQRIGLRFGAQCGYDGHVQSNRLAARVRSIFRHLEARAARRGAAADRLALQAARLELKRSRLCFGRIGTSAGKQEDAECLDEAFVSGSDRQFSGPGAIASCANGYCEARKAATDSDMCGKS